MKLQRIRTNMNELHPDGTASFHYTFSGSQTKQRLAEETCSGIMEYWEAKLSSKVIIGSTPKTRSFDYVLFTSSDAIGNIQYESTESPCK